MIRSRALMALFVAMMLTAAACAGDSSSADGSEVAPAPAAGSGENDDVDTTTADAQPVDPGPDDTPQPSDQDATQGELPFKSGSGSFSVDGTQSETQWVVRCMPFQSPGSEPDDRDLELLANGGENGYLSLYVGVEDLQGMGDNNYTSTTFKLDWGRSVVEEQIEGLITGPDGKWYFGEVGISLALGNQTSEPLTESPYVIAGDRISGRVDIAAVDPDQPDGVAIEFDLSIPSEVFDCSEL